MSVFYSFAYRFGFTPWERAASHPPAARQLAAALDLEERERTPPLGKALDLGCGSGFWSVELARRGWDVTGIDLVPKAIERARGRAKEAHVAVRFVTGDMTALSRAGVGSGFDFVWDFGALHGLDDAQRRAVGEQVTAATTKQATMLVLAWSPGRRWFLPRGAGRADLEAMFPGWNVIDEQSFDVSGLPAALRKVDPRLYRLRRTGTRQDSGKAP